MSAPAASCCLVSPYLGRVELRAGVTRQSWTAGPIAPDAVPIAAMRARAAEAAAWIAAQPTLRRRLTMVCIDVEESACMWVKAPSGEPPVLAAAVRSLGQDWGDLFPVGMVQALRDPQQASPASPASGPAGAKPSLFAAITRPIGASASTAAPVCGPVLAAPLGLIRVWLDELDARAVRPEQVVSLWHAQACAWADQNDSLTAVVQITLEGRVVWTWSRGHDLCAAGQFTLQPPAETSKAPSESAESAAAAAPAEPSGTRTSSRLALDWMSWAAHTGSMPDRVVIVATAPEALARELAARWPSIQVEPQTQRDPLDATLERALAAAPRRSGQDPRRSLSVLTSRPTRAMRTQFRWIAAALVLVAGAIGVLGWRFNRAAIEMRLAADKVQEQQGSLVTSLEEPTLAQSRNIVMALQSILVDIRKKEPPKLPPEPKPVYEEIARVTQILERFEGAKLLSLSIDTRGSSSLQLSVPDRRTGEEIKLELQRGGGPLAWADAGGMATDQQLRLNGTWTR